MAVKNLFSSSSVNSTITYPRLLFRTSASKIRRRTINPAVASSTLQNSSLGCSKNQQHVCVLGAGVAGMTTAVQLLESLPGVHVTVIAENLGANTTSHGAGGLWKPYTLGVYQGMPSLLEGDTPAELVNRWGQLPWNTTCHCTCLLRQRMQAAAKGVQPHLLRHAGVMLTSAYQLWTEHVPDPEWSAVVPNFRHLTPSELELYDPTASHVQGWFYTTVVTEGRLYLRWLLKRFVALGGTTVQKRILDIDELAGFNALVNCSGLGAMHLFRDNSMYPVRGQVLRVKAPWVRHYCNSNGNCYIIPNRDTLVLGGTLQKGDSDVVPREEDTKGILQRCIAVMPSLRAAEVEDVWVGLRPGRPSVRLEVEYRASGSGSFPIVHNYGHGGAGLTLAWGCAQDVVHVVSSLQLGY